MFRNAAFARFTIDAARWPIAAGFVERVLGTEAFRRLKPLEDRLIRTPISQHRAVLAGMDVPLMAETYGTSSPHRCIMQI